MSPKDADGLTNSVDPDQTATLGAVLSGSTLFPQTYLSENLGPICRKLTVVQEKQFAKHFCKSCIPYLLLLPYNLKLNVRNCNFPP